MLLLVLIILCSCISRINSFLCDSRESLYCNQLNATPVKNCNINEFGIHSNTCTLITSGKYNDFAKGVFGDVSLWLYPVNTTMILQSTISLLDEYKEAYIKLTEYVDHKYDNCKQFNFKQTSALTMNTVLFNCLWDSKKQLKISSYLMEVTALKNTLLHSPQKLLFSIPNSSLFGEHVPLNKRLIFAYIDCTDINKIILKVQPLPTFYNVTQYKIEVIKEQDKKVQMVDIRIIAYDQKSKYIDFEYRTFNEEGYHYFTMSVISSLCPEDVCEKTVTAKLYISRKGTHLVIGIVGASFLIPLVLYLFYAWSCKYKHLGDHTETRERVLVLYDPSFNKHNEVVTALAKTIKHLSGIDVIIDPLNITRNTKDDLLKQCSDNLILSTYIIYLTPPIIGDMEDYTVDVMTYNFLKTEIQKPNSEKKVAVVHFPYTNCQPPPFLSYCSSFELMKDFSSFMQIFEEITETINYENNPFYKDLSEKIKKAQAETENLVTILPNIVIEHDEPREIDVLL